MSPDSERSPPLVSRSEARDGFAVRSAYDECVKAMCRLNLVAARLMRKHGDFVFVFFSTAALLMLTDFFLGAHAATDVTGYGILGHARSLASGMTAAVDLEIDVLPVFSGMAAADAALEMRFKVVKGSSAETSGE